MEDRRVKRIELPEAVTLARGAGLYRAIFESANPEAVVHALPAQAVYMALQGYGFESGGDLLAILPEGHYRFALDLHLWERDNISEEAFFQWLEAIDQDDSLVPLQRFVHAVDPKFLAAIFVRYVHAIVGEEPTELPPDEGYYTPDQGYTWVEIQTDSPDRLRALAKVLAMLYETQKDLFYQLLNESTGSTGVELEEEAYFEKNRRLSDEGFPDAQSSAIVHSPLDADRFRTLLGSFERRPIETPPTFAPLLRSPDRLEPLSSLLEATIPDAELRVEVEAELSLIVNAALVRYAHSMADFSEVENQIRRVRGTLNIGLERVALGNDLAPLDILKKTGLQPIYRVGIWELSQLRRSVREFLALQQAPLESEALKSLARGVMDGDNPQLPESYGEDGSYKSGAESDGKLRPFAYLSEIKLVREAFQSKR